MPVMSAFMSVTLKENDRVDSREQSAFRNPSEDLLKHCRFTLFFSNKVQYTSVL